MLAVRVVSWRALFKRAVVNGHVLRLQQSVLLTY